MGQDPPPGDPLRRSEAWRGDRRLNLLLGVGGLPPRCSLRRRVSDAPIADVLEAHLLEHAGDRRLAFLLGVPFGKAQAGGEGERLLDAEEVVQRVVLGHVADVGLAQADILAADQDRAGARGADAPRRLQSVLLPDPLGPTIATSSPGSSVSLATGGCWPPAMISMPCASSSHARAAPVQVARHPVVLLSRPRTTSMQPGSWTRNWCNPPWSSRS